MSLITKMFGTYSQRQLKKLTVIADRIDALAEKYAAMTNEELQGVTPALRARLAAGETTDDILTDAFAAIREADTRVLGKRPFRVQILGGIVLHQGRIAEMKTGEGKTLVATLPAYLNALSGNGVHIVTVNDYLARVGAEEMGRVYEFMGLTTGLVVHGQSHEEKQAAYRADITYGTNNEFGFDYLRDNMAVYKRDMVQRGHVFAIVDEVDSILIDEARTPLIISGSGEKATDLYERAERLVRGMRKFVIKELDNKKDQDDINADYVVDEKANHAVLTPQGVKKTEQFFGIENLSDMENAMIAHHVNQAISAHGCKHRDVDYVVNEKGVVIVDAFTGRLMPGRRYSDGLHQAIEAKEGVQVQKENKTLATITFQNYFRMYRKLSGMTGTALTEESEFREIYRLDVVEIPTNKPMIRIDHPDVVYRGMEGKYRAIVEKIRECHEKGQPVLVGTVSIDKSEALSARLTKAGIRHTVLNAKHHEKEAEIVAQAGKFGAVTISTNMAGRGTDILLGGNPEFMAKAEMRSRGYDEELIQHCTGFTNTDDEALAEARETFRALVKQYREEIEPEAKRVREAGGLFILGTERHESRRIDNQLRGRAGRQGDPGESRFFLSMEDDLMRLFGTDRIQGIVSALKIKEDECVDLKVLSGGIERAQNHLEENNFKRRKYVLAYDDVMNHQRTIIYKQRQDVLDEEDVSETIRKMFLSSVESAVAEFTNGDVPDEWDFDGLRSYFAGTLTTDSDFHYTQEELNHLERESITELLSERILARYEEKEKLFGAEMLRELERAILLRQVDLAWMEHLDTMEDLKGSVGLQAYAQRDPITEFRIQGAELFEGMVEEIRQKTVRALLSLVPQEKPIKRVQVAKPIFAGPASPVVKHKKAPVAGRAPTTFVKSSADIGRNDLCPCGSGKKYKACCMRKNAGN
ncbi:MAG: preprotein translocase subunit SecA [Ruminococcaceae bacterium]|nr:preprotein translocase subunit SecA [Oscillospiraceae bacterium]